MIVLANILRSSLDTRALTVQTFWKKMTNLFDPMFYVFHPKHQEYFFNKFVTTSHILTYHNDIAETKTRKQYLSYFLGVDKEGF